MNASTVTATSDEVAALPWYTRALDAALAMAALIAVSTTVFGGFRVRFDDLRISLQSPLRAWLIAMAIFAVRRLLTRSPSPWRRLRQAAVNWRADAAVRSALGSALCIRAPVIASAYFAVLILGYPTPDGPPFRVSANEFVNLPARWDAGWYLTIAVDGYSASSRRDVQQNIAFFPAYPMLMRVGGLLLGGRSPAGDGQAGHYQARLARASERALLAGWLISLGATFVALVYLFRFARETLGGDAPAGSVLLLSAYPFAYFFGAVYTEGLFLLGTVATLRHFRRGEWGAAGAWGLLVGLTRPNGCLLSVPLALMALQRSFVPSTLRAGDPAPRPGAAGFVPAIVTAAAPGVGMLIYSAWLWQFAGHPLAWMQAHQAWGRTFQSVGALLTDRAETIGTLGIYEYSAGQPIEALYVLCVLLCLGVAWPVGRRLGFAYAVLMLITIVPPLSAGGFLSMGRITATLFPVFVYLGWRLSPSRQVQFAMGSVALQGMLAALFFTWRPVF